MQCPNCHADHQHGLFCTKCGAPLNDDTCDMTRVMPPLETPETPAQINEEEAPEQASPLSSNKDTTDDMCSPDSTTQPSPDLADAADDEDVADDILQANSIDQALSDDVVLDASTAYHLTNEENDSSDTVDASEAVDADALDTDPPETAIALDEDHSEEANDEDPTDTLDEALPTKKARNKKLLTILALVVGIGLAALSAIYLFNSFFNTQPVENPTEKIKNATTITPDKGIAEDAIVGHWRHYNTGSVIEKIGTARYRWTISGHPYQLKFKDNQYIYEDEKGNTYAFALVGADRIHLVSSADAHGGLISNPVFENGYIAGRVGQDGTMTKNLSVNTDVFDIVGKTYAELAGTYGPGSLSVIGDDQYLVFRAKNGNFAVQFTGDTVPLKQASTGYTVEKLTNTTPTNPEPITPSTPDTNDPPDHNDGVMPPPTPNAPDSDEEDEKDKEFKVEIPDMPTFPSNSAVATGVLWVDLGLFINNAPDTMTVEDLSAVLGIALEVGSAPSNESGFAFYGMNDGYFAGTYGINDHTYYISGYGNQSLSADKTMIFIQLVN